jgi:hypothetical protein
MDLYTRVLETMAWCSVRATIFNPRNSLRSDELQPSSDFTFDFDSSFLGNAIVRSFPWVRSLSEMEELMVYSQQLQTEAGRFVDIYVADTNREVDEQVWVKSSEWLRLINLKSALTNAVTVINRRLLVESVGLRRKQLVRQFTYFQDALKNGLPHGRFLLCDDPSASLSEGACFNASQGFFDAEFDMPPWDTWISFAFSLDLFGDLNSVVGSTSGLVGSSHQLLVWIPDCFVELVSEGVYASSTNMFVWATEVDIPVTRELRKLGLLV